MLGGSYVTISGPAAGLAPALFAGMIMLSTAYLGKDAPQAELLKVGLPLGARRHLHCRACASRAGPAEGGPDLSAIFPSAAIEGMLAAIGLIIIVKQFPLLLGQPFESHEFWEILKETPQKLATMNVQVFGLGVGCIVILFALAALPWKLFKIMPPPVWAFFFGTTVSWLFLNVGVGNLIKSPKTRCSTGSSCRTSTCLQHAGHLAAFGLHHRRAAVDRRDGIAGDDHGRR